MLNGCCKSDTWWIHAHYSRLSSANSYVKTSWEFLFKAHNLSHLITHKNICQMASLAEQLRAIQLRKSAEPMKDYSSPKTVGFTTASEVTILIFYYVFFLHSIIFLLLFMSTFSLCVCWYRYIDLHIDNLICNSLTVFYPESIRILFCYQTFLIDRNRILCCIPIK